MIEEYDTMFSVRQTPWHGLGVVIQEAVNSEDALRIAGLNWEVIQEPIFREDQTRIKNHVANIRSDTSGLLGIVTNRYQIIQNYEAFSFTDALLGEGVKYETAGSLQNGKRVWMLAKMDSVKILDDNIAPYLVFTHGHDGKNSVKVSITPVRVVCNNTLNLALNSAQRAWSTHHIGDIQNKLGEAQRTLGLAQEYLVKLNEEAENLVNLEITDDIAKDMIKMLYPISEKSSSREIVNIQSARNTMFKVYTGTKDIQKFRNTGWGFVNAVSDYIGHSDPLRRTNTYQENRFSKIVNGHPIMDKTIELLKVA